MPRSKTKEYTNAKDYATKYSKQRSDKTSVFDFVWENKSNAQLESQKDRRSVIVDLKERKALNMLT